MPKKLIKWLLSVLGALCIAIFIAAGTFYYYLSHSLPAISSLQDYRPSVITTVYADDNQKVAEFYNMRRLVLPLDKMPEVLINAFIAAEDARFFQHTGIDLISVFRAFLKNMEAGGIVQGGSTITQQVAKSFFLSPKRTYTRKAKEAILSYRIEKQFSKKEILFLYLNQIYLGHGAYGVEAAAQNYFRKSAADLNLAECALLAGLPQAPSRYSPFRYPDRAKSRQLYVLRQMQERGYISPQEAEATRQTKIDISPVKNWFREMTPWYAEYARRYVENKYGRDMLYNEGLSIYTAVNVDMQKIAREEIEKGLRALDKRQGYRGPEAHLAEAEVEPFLDRLREDIDSADLPFKAGAIIKGVVAEVNDAEKQVRVRLAFGSGSVLFDDMTWARTPDEEVAWYKAEAKIRKPSQALAVGDVVLVRIINVSERADEAPPPEDDPVKNNSVEPPLAVAAQKNTLYVLSLEQTPAAESALICMENKTGFVKAMIGGRDASNSQFNRAIQARRQPGSAFKPIVYAAALDKNYTAASMIVDSAIVFKDEEHDFTWKPQNYEEHFFGPTLFRRAFIKSHNIPTIKILMDIGVDYVREYARKLGVTSPLSRDLSIALGSSGLAPAELIQAYSTFANLGEKTTPIFIEKILDRDGRVLEENRPSSQRVIGKDTAYIMTHLLKGVVEHGTGRRVRALNRPAAGKTGTTDNLDDAWFVGYTPDYVTAVWVGYDEERSLGAKETGASAASPIWLGFMKRMLAEKPVKSFEVPEGVVFSKIDADTGLLPIAESENTFFECFKEGTVPTEHTKRPDAVVEEEQFFKKGMF
jgi:penicillin-binding protein 1A